MTFPLSRDAIEAAFVAACHAELQALKPGNVHVHSAGHGMDIHHFERAAAAAAPFIADPSLSVGARILGAVKASFAVTGLNTNLGIILLTAPLAKAAEAPSGGADLRDRLAHVLDGLDRADATDAFEAIVIANPAGLGSADQGDVNGVATVTLLEAMALAADRDRIAKAYVTGFDDLFTLGLPALHAARRAAANETLAITALHMTYLAEFPDSHIARKFGIEVAESVRGEARNAASLWQPAPRHETWDALRALDKSFKDRGINPGTTADLVVATLFADMLNHQSATTKPV